MDSKRPDRLSATTHPTLTAGNNAASAVGVSSEQTERPKALASPPERCWFVAVVKNLTENSCAQGLNSMGFEVYVPTETRVSETPSGKRHERPHALIAARLFLHATEEERQRAVNTPYILRFMTDIAGRTDRLGRRPLAVIPDEQMQALQYMVFNASKPVSISEGGLLRGDKVKVMRGPLKGLEGIVERDPSGASRIYITLDTFGCASTELDLESVERA